MIDTLLNAILSYAFLYPIVMSFVWIIGGYYYKHKRNKELKRMKVPLKEEHFVVVIPVYNEESSIEELLTKNLRTDYSNVLFWVINDCSTDRTKMILEKFEEGPRLKITHLEENLGKSGVLNYALDKLHSNYFICIDSDTLIYPNMLKVLNNTIYNETDETVSAYTGSLTIEQAGEYATLLKIQKLEYRSIISMIKKTQDSFLNNLMTVSGAVVCYKTKVIQKLGGFCEKNATEDIEITWRMTTANLRVRYIENMCGEIVSPKTNYTLFKQRVRWSLGGIQTIFSYSSILKKSGLIANKIFIFENILSILWIFSFIFVQIYLVLKAIFGFPSALELGSIILSTIILIVTSCFLQIVAYRLDKGCKEYVDEFLIIMLAYPLVYWIIQPISYFGGLFKYFGRRNEETHKWRKLKKRSLRRARVYSALVDLIVYFVIVYILKIIVIEIFMLLPETIVSVYYISLIFWMIIGIIYYRYFILPKRATFGESLVGLTSFRLKNVVQNFFNPVSLFILINTLANAWSIRGVLLFDTYEHAAMFFYLEITESGVIHLNMHLFLILVFIDKYFSIYEKFSNNRMMFEK